MTIFTDKEIMDEPINTDLEDSIMADSQESAEERRLRKELEEMNRLNQDDLLASK